MMNNNRLMPCNMFIMTWHDFDAYCTWIFQVLSEMEKRTDISHYNPIQKRIYGYMAERLFNVWLYAHKFKLIHKPVLLFNDAATNIPPLQQLQRDIRADLAMAIIKQRRTL